jgi:hypothetical protein
MGTNYFLSLLEATQCARIIGVMTIMIIAPLLVYKTTASASWEAVCHVCCELELVKPMELNASATGSAPEVGLSRLRGLLLDSGGRRAQRSWGGVWFSKRNTGCRVAGELRCGGNSVVEDKGDS